MLTVLCLSVCVKKVQIMKWHYAFSYNKNIERKRRLILGKREEEERKHMLDGFRSSSFHMQ